MTCPKCGSDKEPILEDTEEEYDDELDLTILIEYYTCADCEYHWEEEGSY